MYRVPREGEKTEEREKTRDRSLSWGYLHKRRLGKAVKIGAMTLTALPGSPFSMAVPACQEPGSGVTAGPPCNTLHMLTQAILTAAQLVRTNSYPPGTGLSGHTQWVRTGIPASLQGPPTARHAVQLRHSAEGQLTTPGVSRSHLSF